jgi:hypothetical protein
MVEAFPSWRRSFYWLALPFPPCQNSVGKTQLAKEEILELMLVTLIQTNRLECASESLRFLIRPEAEPRFS